MGRTRARKRIHWQNLSLSEQRALMRMCGAQVPQNPDTGERGPDGRRTYMLRHRREDKSGIACALNWKDAARVLAGESWQDWYLVRGLPYLYQHEHHGDGACITVELWR